MLDDWLASGLPLIDCRPFADYCRGHAAGATSLPAGQLFERLHELPVPGQPLWLCGEASELPSMADRLAARRHEIAGILSWDAGLQQRLQRQCLLQQGSRSRRLWRPAPLLQRFVGQMPAWGIAPGRGLDLACGAGRDLVFLAENGWQMTGVDYLPDALGRAARLAQDNRQAVTLLHCDLEKDDRPFRHQRFDLVCVMRYLHRPLLPWIRQLLNPGGVLVYQTFMQGCEKISSPRNPNYLLASGELAGMFADGEILLDERELLADGRPLSAFIARFHPV